MARVELDNLELTNAARAGGLIEVVDRTTGQAYYLISSEKYQTICSALSGDLDPREFYPAIDKVLAEDDANDPLLDSYQ